jgi:energy-coupling factor transporter transmembrane protein EcfT
MPAIVKILVLIPLAITIMHINIKYLPPLIVIIAVSAFLCGWTLKEFWFDIKPTIFYGFFLYEFNVITNVINGLKENTITISVLLPNYEYIVYFIKLILLLQVSTLFFRTSTSIAIKDALCGIERAIRLFIKQYIAKQISLKTKFADNFALTLNFIPEIFEQLSKIDLAYRARGGKKG